jgi:hypothetical protein
MTAPASSVESDDHFSPETAGCADHRIQELNCAATALMLDAAAISFHIGRMKDEAREKRRNLLWGLPTSLMLHALVIAFLIYGLPRSLQQPQEEQAVNVALVPLPDQPKPKPAPKLIPKDRKVEKAPRPKVEELPEQKVEKERPPKRSPIEVLKPVFHFGDKDTGPRKSLDGDNAEDNLQPQAKDNERADVIKGGGKQTTSTQGANKRQAEAPDADKQATAEPSPLAAADGDGEIVLPSSAEAPRPRPTNTPRSGLAKSSKSGNEGPGKPSPADVATAISKGYSGLPGVHRLYSQGATGDARATTAMAGVPRDRRAAKLCASELQQQLLNASYFPDLIPLVPLKAGNVLDVPEAAFHTQATWYRLSFRCEVDTNATTVLSFAFRVGSAIPPDEWARLGLPISN